MQGKRGLHEGGPASTWHRQRHGAAPAGTAARQPSAWIDGGIRSHNYAIACILCMCVWPLTRSLQGGRQPSSELLGIAPPGPRPAPSPVYTLAHLALPPPAYHLTACPQLTFHEDTCMTGCQFPVNILFYMPGLPRPPAAPHASPLEGHASCKGPPRFSIHGRGNCCRDMNLQAIM